MKETWKEIIGYKGLYRVSSKGEVRSLGKGNTNNCRDRILKGYIGKGGNTKYKFFILYKDGKPKRFQLHRLVAINFIPNPENKPQVNHIDGNGLNNNVSNLEWVTASENLKHRYNVLGYKGTWSGRTGKDNPNSIKVNQYDLSGNFIKTWDSMKDIENGLNIFYQGVSKVCKGKQKAAGGYKWRYFTK